MITSNPIRIRKTHSLIAPKDDKENCNNNIQVQGPTKIAKFRESLSQCNQPANVISSLKVEIKDELEEHGLTLKREYSKLAKRDYSS
jgi:hypothetical protein